jgi:uncharacterized membrane protein YphA (DoxX/SURF4 family)
MTWPLRILRAFLGVTFLYAGIQKFMDPGFLHAGSQTYIGTQLRGFAAGRRQHPSCGCSIGRRHSSGSASR